MKTAREILTRAGALGDVLEAYDATERAVNVTRDLLPWAQRAKIEKAKQLLFEVRVELEITEEELDA